MLATRLDNLFVNQKDWKKSNPAPRFPKAIKPLPASSSGFVYFAM